MEGNILLLNLILWPMVGAFICYLSGWKRIPFGVEGSTETKEEADKRKKGRDSIAIAVLGIEVLLYVFAIISFGTAGELLKIDGVCGLGISFRFGGFRTIYAGVAILMWSMTTLFSREYFEHYRNRNRYFFFCLITLGATLGVFMSDDLYTAFIFFEIMSLTSYTWVAHDEKPAAMKAAGTYLAVAVIGGLVMLMGIFILYHTLGTLKINELYPAARLVLEGWVKDKGTPASIYAAGACILFGFGAKAGMFPLHIWLPKAHPASPAPASALLSGILTKSGIYGVLVLCFEIFRNVKPWGILIMGLGTVTMVLGAVLAVFSVDLKRTLACSSMSQIGFILTGCATSVLLGEENSLAAAGTVLYMVNHSIFKLVLFMCAGAVYMRLHKLDLNDLKGCGRRNKPLMVCFAIGALGIMGVPLFSGYISKTLIHEGIVELFGELEGTAAFLVKSVEYLFLLSGGMTIGYMLKLFTALFIEKPDDETSENKVSKPLRPASVFALALSSVIIVACGVVPSIYIDKLSVYMSDITHAEEIEHISIFSLENLKGFVISLAIGLLVFLFTRKVLRGEENGRKAYLNRWPGWLDLEELVYRPLIMKVLPGMFGAIFGFFVKFVKVIWKWILTAGRSVTHVTALVFIIWKGILNAGRFIGKAGSCFGEIVIYSVKKVFFKELDPDRKNPVLEKLYVRLDAADRTVRIIEATISYSIIWLMIGLIVTILFLLFY